MSITGTDLNLEIKKLDLVAEKTTDERGLIKALVKVGTLMLKVLHDIRGNQVKIGTKLGVEFRKPNKRVEDSDRG